MTPEEILQNLISEHDSFEFTMSTVLAEESLEPVVLKGYDLGGGKVIMPTILQGKSRTRYQ